MFKKILSYIYYFEKSTMSLYNGKVRVILRDGKKILNTNHANYSFGSLHRIMCFALGNIILGTDEDILLLGLGAGSVIDIVRNNLHISNKFIAVDIDPVIIEIARQEFGLDSYENTEIICADAYQFIAETSGKYGLIIIDLFIDNKVPEKFYGDIFWGHISRILSQNGQIIFNTMIENNSRELFDTLTQYLENKGFLVTIHEKVAGSNLMMIMKRKTLE